VTCPCGNREAYIECGVSETLLEHSLPCNNSCSNKQRFALFYQLNQKQAYYPAALIRFAKNNFYYLLKLETKLEQLINSSENSMDMNFILDQKKRLAVQILLNRHYNLET
jgi:transcriptional repressor NF-X1